MASVIDNSEAKNVAVIGAGSWGTALAIAAARNKHQVRLWAREAEVARAIQLEHRNPIYLSDITLQENISASTSFSEVLHAADFVLVVVPSHAMREVIAGMRSSLKDNTVIVSATKGVENDSL